MIQCPHCSGEFSPTSKRRSVPAHRRFFALVRAAHENWPENHPYQPLNANSLRTFLQMKAGWNEPVEVNGVMYLLPRSISFPKMSQSDFNTLCERVEQYLESLGIEPEKALKQLMCA